MDTPLQSVVLKIQLCAVALMATAGFLSNPDYYLWAVAPFAVLAVAYNSLDAAASKRLLLIAYALVAAFSFIVGRLFFDADALSGTGIALILAIVVVASGVLARIYFNEVAPDAT